MCWPALPTTSPPPPNRPPTAPNHLLPHPPRLAYRTPVAAGALRTEPISLTPAQSPRDAALDEFLHQQYTNEKIDRAINSKSNARGGFNVKLNGNQVSTGWFHSREQYRAVLRLAFFTEDRVRPPTLNREAAPCTQALGSPAWRAQATVLRYPPPRSTGKVHGLPRLVQEGKP